MTTTFAEVLGLYDITVPDDLIADVEVPVLAGAQRQGDVGIYPRDRITPAMLSQMAVIPPEGVQVVRGEATGNTHLLHSMTGVCRWAPAVNNGSESTLLGILSVDDGGEAYLIHTDEHSANGIAPGTYELRGKREMADEIRRVAD